MSAKTILVNSIAKRRKGKASILDAMLYSLHRPRTDAEWPELVISDIAKLVSAEVGRAVAKETIRAYIHKRSEFFEKRNGFPPKWKLSKRGKDIVRNGD